MPWKGENMKKKNPLFYVFLVIFIVVIVYICITIKNNYLIGADAYNNAASNVSIVKNGTNETPKVQINKGQIYKYEDIVSLDVDWTKFDTSKVIGWIQVEDDDTIDYPIVQSKDNDYYLHHLYDDTESNQGSIFVDYRNEGFGNRHTILYGHNMKNGSMFSHIKKYQNEEYANEHRYIYVATPNGETRVFYVYSCHLTNALGDEDGFNAYQVSFNGDEEWQNWIKETQERSLITSNIEIPNDGCNILTLSTCMSRGDENERCVIHAIEVSNKKLVETK